MSTDDSTRSQPRKQMDRKEWKKLKKSCDIRHTFNDSLSTCNGTGATVINTVETEAFSQITSMSLSFPSPASNRSSIDLKKIEEEEIENRSRGSSFTKLDCSPGDTEKEELVARL